MGPVLLRLRLLGWCWNCGLGWGCCCMLLLLRCCCCWNCCWLTMGFVLGAGLLLARFSERRWWGGQIFLSNCFYILQGCTWFDFINCFYINTDHITDTACTHVAFEARPTGRWTLPGRIPLRRRTATPKTSRGRPSLEPAIICGSCTCITYKN